MEEIKRISKQILVMRKDLRNSKGEKIRTGKYCSQASHASVKAILDLMNHTEISIDGTTHLSSLDIKKGSALEDWLFNGMFTKITVCVSSEAELLEVYDKAKDKGLICSLITDAGLTEFNGVPTLTCCAVGPAWDSEIGEITGKLSLL
jgi:PTH2 family peptidyl-tRNA hydrolase